MLAAATMVVVPRAVQEVLAGILFLGEVQVFNKYLANYEIDSVLVFFCAYPPVVDNTMPLKTSAQIQASTLQQSRQRNPGIELKINRVRATFMNQNQNQDSNCNRFYKWLFISVLLIDRKMLSRSWICLRHQPVREGTCEHWDHHQGFTSLKSPHSGHADFF